MLLREKHLYEFGKFRCNPEEHLLLRDGEPVLLSPKCFEILLVLIRSNGRLLSKDELMHQVWPDSFVEEANLTVHVSALRKALGETTGERFIETVPKFGYRFTVPVRECRDEFRTGSPAVAVPALESPVATPERVKGNWFRRWWPVLTAIVLVAAAISVFLIVRGRPRLTEKDTVVLSDFENNTGDQAFDGALRQGLSSQLEQSPYLNLLSEERIAQTLSLMAQPKDARLTHDLSREVCQRTGARAVLEPSISQVGARYLLTLKAINCSNGDSLASAEAQAADKDHVLEAPGRVASKIRNQLGESLASVAKYDAPPENVTTPSLEALKAYGLAYRAVILNGDYAGAIPLFQRAIHFDPNFAMAYARLGTSYYNLYETVDADAQFRKAYELRERVSEREKQYIASHYELFVTGNLEAARQIYELSAQTYPHDIPLNNLGLIYSELGEFEKALAAFQNVLVVSTGTGNRYGNLVSGYLQLNRLEEAKATAREAKSRNIDAPDIHLNLYWVAFLEHDAAAMARESAELMGKPGHEDQMFNYEADTALWAGQLEKARGFARRAIDSAEKAHQREAPALYTAVAAVREALVGNAKVAREQAYAAIALSKGRDVEAIAAIALKKAGDPVSANRLATDLENRFPEDTIVRTNYLPAIRTNAANIRDSAQAKPGASVPNEFGGNLVTVNFVLYPVYLRGEAYLEAHQAEAAAAEFQKIIDHPGAVRNEPIGVLARLQLGRAFRMGGDRAKAKAAYQEFLTVWKDADPEIPVLKEAKAEYAGLE